MRRAAAKDAASSTIPKLEELPLLRVRRRDERKAAVCWRSAWKDPTLRPGDEGSFHFPLVTYVSVEDARRTTGGTGVAGDEGVEDDHFRLTLPGLATARLGLADAVNFHRPFVNIARGRRRRWR